MKNLQQGVNLAQESDLRLSHAFVSTLGAAYRGMWVFETMLMELDVGVDRRDEVDKAERVLETISGWWKDLEAGDPLFRMRKRPVLQGEASQAWRLLQVAEGRARSLIGELTKCADVEALVQDSWARTIRLCALLEAAHVQRETVLGLIRLADALGCSAEAERWRHRLLTAEGRLDDAEAIVGPFLQAPEIDETMARKLFDASLLLPAQVAQRVVDMSQVFGMYTGVFDYTDAGIPEAQSETWAEAGFEPRQAGRWFAAGLTPSRAAAWMEVGASDPLVAAGFMWRGFSPGEAAPWLERFIEGRRAAAWQQAGCDAEDAREWISLGIRHPERVPAIPDASRPT